MDKKKRIIRIAISSDRFNLDLIYQKRKRKGIISKLISILF